MARFLAASPLVITAQSSEPKFSRVRGCELKVKTERGLRGCLLSAGIIQTSPEVRNCVANLSKFVFRPWSRSPFREPSVKGNQCVLDTSKSLRGRPFSQSEMTNRGYVSWLPRVLISLGHWGREHFSSARTLAQLVAPVTTSPIQLAAALVSCSPVPNSEQNQILRSL